MDVVRHHNETVQLKLVLGAVPKESVDEELCMRSPRKMAVSLVSKNTDGVSALRLPDSGHTIESIPQGLKPLSDSSTGRQG